MLSNNLNILNQQQQQRIPFSNQENISNFQTNTSTKKPAQKVNIVKQGIQNNVLPQLPQNQIKSSNQEYNLQLNSLQQRRSSEIQQQNRPRNKLGNINEKENIQSYLQDMQPRSRTPFNVKENQEKHYERDVCSSLSKTRESLQVNTKLIELNVTQLNDRVEGKHRQFRRQSLDQHYLNNQSDNKKERNKYNNYLGQLQVSSSSITSTSQNNKFSQQNDERMPIKNSQIEIAQMIFQNSFLNVKQILKNQSTQNTQQNDFTQDNDENQQEQQSKNNSLASLNNSVPLNSILKGELNIYPPSNKSSSQQIRATYITSLLSPVSDIDQNKEQQTSYNPEIVLLPINIQDQINKNKHIQINNENSQKKDANKQDDNTSVKILDTKDICNKFQEVGSYNNFKEQNIKKTNCNSKNLYKNKFIILDANQIQNQQEQNHAINREAVQKKDDKNENMIKQENQGEQSECRVTSENERMAKVFNNFEIQQRIKRIKNKGLDDNAQVNQSAYYNINTSAEEYINTKEDEDIIFQNLSLFENHVLNNHKIEINLEGIQSKKQQEQQIFNEISSRDKVASTRSGNGNVINVNLIPNPNFSKTKSKSIQPNILRGKKLKLKQILEKNQKLRKQTPFHILRNEMQAQNDSMSEQTLKIFTKKNGPILQDHNFTLKSEMDNTDIFSVQRIDLQSADSSIQPSQRYYGGSQFRGRTVSNYTKTTIDEDNSVYARNAYAIYTSEMMKTNASIYTSEQINKTQEEEVVIEGKQIILKQDSWQSNNKQETIQTDKNNNSSVQQKADTLPNQINSNSSMFTYQKARKNSIVNQMSYRSNIPSHQNNDEQLIKVRDDTCYGRKEPTTNNTNQKQVVIQNQLRNFEEEALVNKKNRRKTIVSTLNCKELKQQQAMLDKYILEEDQKQEQNSPERSIDVAYMNQILHSKNNLSKQKNEIQLIHNNRQKCNQNVQNTQIHHKKAVSLSLYYIGNLDNDNIIPIINNNNIKGLGEKKYQPISLYQQAQQSLSNFQKQQQQQQTNSNNQYPQNLDLKVSSYHLVSN